VLAIFLLLSVGLQSEVEFYPGNLLNRQNLKHLRLQSNFNVVVKYNLKTKQIKIASTIAAPLKNSSFCLPKKRSVTAVLYSSIYNEECL